MSQDLICVSDLPGGPAEFLLRSMAQNYVNSSHMCLHWGTKWQGSGVIQSRDGVVSGLLRNSRGGVSKKHLPLRFILGMQRGVVLVDRDLGRKHFSTIHVCGMESRNIDYAIPVSPSIMEGVAQIGDEIDKELKKRVKRNLRSAAFSVLAFLLAHPERQAIVARQVMYVTEASDRRIRHELNVAQHTRGLNGHPVLGDVQCCVEMVESGDFRHVWQPA